MRNDFKYANSLLTLTVHSAVAVRQAQGHLARTFGITMKTAAKATDRLFNGTYDKDDNRIAPKLELNEQKDGFILVDEANWHAAQAKAKHFAESIASGKVVTLHSVRAKRNFGSIKQV